MARKWLNPGDERSSDYINEDEWTPWERRMKNRFPEVNPVIDTDWGERNRDIVAFGRCKVQEMLRDGHDPRRGPARDLADSIEDFTRDGLPLSKDILDDYANAPGATIQASHETSYSKQRSMLESDENDDLIDDVKSYARERHFGVAHVKRWNQVLTALGVETGERPMTLAEADDNLRRFNKGRWQPVVDALRKRSKETDAAEKDEEPYQYGIDLTEALEVCAAEGKFQWYLYIQAEMGTYVAQYSGQAPGFPVSRSVCDAISARFPRVYMTKMRAFSE